MEAPQKHSLVGQPIGKYRVSRKLGQGTAGEIFEVVHTSIGYRAAIKVLPGQLARDPNHQQFVARFLDEARAVNFIDHPGIVKIFDLDELPDGSLYIMMEFLEGKTLSEELQSAPGKRLDLDEAVRITRQIAAVMVHVHGKGVLHRDLKPDNVILVADGEAAGKRRIKLIDFGLAKFLDSPERRTTMGLALGTPTYMAPEQCLASDSLDGRADVYSLGIMLYEMLAGGPPFTGTQQAVMKAHVGGTLPPLQERAPGLPPAVYQVVAALLAKAPAQRPDMGQLEARMAQLEADLRKGQRPAAASRKQLAVGLGAGALAMLVLGGGAGLAGRGRLQRSLCTTQYAADAGLCPAPPPVAAPAAPPAADSAPAAPPAVEKAVDKEAAAKAGETPAKHHKPGHKGK